MAMRLLTLGTADEDADTIPLPANTIYGIADDGVLYWYKYLGNGESNPAPGRIGWDPNSGNAILYLDLKPQFAFTWFQLSTSGRMVAIDETGRLSWWRYEGSGRGWGGGRVGWVLSGGAIAEGWGDYEHVLVLQEIGDDVILLTVDHDGVMLPHAYTKGVGWDADFSTPMPGNWSGFTRLIATTATIFGVKEDGNLYRYQPNWTLKPVVWTQDANWGNQIGTGWGTLRQLVVGGGDDPDIGSHPTFVGIDPVGGLRWFRYTGVGSGAATDWAPNSGNLISGSW